MKLIYAIVLAMCSLSVMAQEVQIVRIETLGNANGDALESVEGHNVVDLGLTVKWATMNIGAANITSAGSYYAWGETKQKATYTTENYSRINMPDTMETVYDIKGTHMDAATTHWGDKWRMPTKDEFQELIDQCEWEWSEVDDTKGYKVTGPNGNSIFLPAVGFKYEDKTILAGWDCYYWSSVLSKSNPHGAYELRFMSDSRHIVTSYRGVGLPIRAVVQEARGEEE